jgi:glycerol-3-phosphate O-acyltransferase
VFLDELLKQYDANWQETLRRKSRRPEWMSTLIEELGQIIMTRINASADVNPVNLLALVLLGTPRHALGEKQLARQIELYQALLNSKPTPERVTVTPKTAEEIIEYGFRMEILRRQEHTLGDIISIRPDRAVGLTYLRNNVAHLFALPSLVACCFLEHRSFQVAHLHKFVTIAHPFLEAELFLPWDQHQITAALDESIGQLLRHGLLVRDEAGETLYRTPDNPEAVMQLRILAHSLLQTLHRYLITISILARNGSGVLSRSELEHLCIHTAQRISMLHEFDAPEFYDKYLFKGFIAQLRKTGYLSPNQDEKLVFDRRLEMISKDAQFILGEAIRQEIDRQEIDRQEIQAPLAENDD